MQCVHAVCCMLSLQYRVGFIQCIVCSLCSIEQGLYSALCVLSMAQSCCLKTSSHFSGDILQLENTFYSQRTHSTIREHILQLENTLYSERERPVLTFQVLILCVCVCVWMCVRGCACVSLSQIHTHRPLPGACLHACIYVYVCVYMHTYMHAYIHAYIHTHTTNTHTLHGKRDLNDVNVCERGRDLSFSGLRPRHSIVGEHILQ